MVCRFWLNNFYNSFDIRKSPLSPSFSNWIFIDLLKEDLNPKPLSTFLLGRSKSQHCFMTVVVTLYRQGALVILTLTKVPKLGLE